MNKNTVTQAAKEWEKSALTNKETLESVIDRTSLQHVLELINDICQEKADHIHANWCDRNLASLWRNSGDRVLVASQSVAVSQISK